MTEKRFRKIMEKEFPEILLASALVAKGAKRPGPLFTRAARIYRAMQQPDAPHTAENLLAACREARKQQHALGLGI